MGYCPYLLYTYGIEFWESPGALLVGISDPPGSIIKFINSNTEVK